MSWSFFGPRIDHDRVIDAIRRAEAKTTGEIRVIVARHKATDPVRAAQAYFNSLGMAHSSHRNGVLVFIAPRSRNFAVIGDTAVHEKCGDSFWTNLTATMGEYFVRENFTDGLVHGIEKAGDLLAAHFPRSGSDAPPRAPQSTEVD